MTDLQVLKLLSNGQEYVILLCCLISIFFSKRLNKSLIIFSLYLFFLMAVGYSMSKMADFRMNNLAMTHFLVLGEFAFLSLFFREILKDNTLLHKYFKNYLIIIGGIILLNSIYFEEINTFNTNAKILVISIIIFFSTTFFYNRSKKLMAVDIEERVLRILNSALLIYYSGSFFVFLFYKFTINNEAFYSKNIMIFNAALYLIFTIIILIAILMVVFHKEKSVET